MIFAKLYFYNYANQLFTLSIPCICISTLEFPVQMLILTTM